jgi:hypothetical protein
LGTLDVLREQVAKTIKSKKIVSESTFSRLAIAIAIEQAQTNKVYRHFLKARKETPDSWKTWQDITPMPVSLFKGQQVRSFEENAEKVWHSSGTTTGTRSQSFLKSTELYDLAIKREVESFLSTELFSDRVELVALVPKSSDWPNSSLAYMFEQIFPNAETNSVWVEDGKLRFVPSAAYGQCLKAMRDGNPVVLFGTSYLFVQLFDWMSEHNKSLSLPLGSTMIDTGGFKGITREITRYEMIDYAKDLLGILPSNVVNEYGMSEMSSQYWNISVEPYVGPHWLRSRVVDPFTLKDSESGVLAHVDLANVWSCIALQTEDRGKVLPDGRIFVSGRMNSAEAKGCSLSTALAHRKEK